MLDPNALIIFEAGENQAVRALEEGHITPEMAEVFPMTDTLKVELPHMLDEHQAIVAALRR